MTDIKIDENIYAVLEEKKELVFLNMILIFLFSYRFVQVSPEQKKLLAQFLNDETVDDFSTIRFWERVAESLNAIGPGIKSAENWKKVCF